MKERITEKDLDGNRMDEEIKQILKDHPEIIDYILTPDWVFTSFRLNAYMAFEVRKSELYLEVTE